MIKWKIIQVDNSKVKLSYYKLCLTKKYYITNVVGNPSLLNKRFEFVKTVDININYFRNLSRAVKD